MNKSSAYTLYYNPMESPFVVKNLAIHCHHGRLHFVIVPQAQPALSLLDQHPSLSYSKTVNIEITV